MSRETTHLKGRIIVLHLIPLPLLPGQDALFGIDTTPKGSTVRHLNQSLEDSFGAKRNPGKQNDRS